MVKGRVEKNEGERKREREGEREAEGNLTPEAS